MAISVNRVYQTVLALANKEQRGYITPQEFNLFAEHAQNEIFEQYFYDLNQALRAPVGNSTVTSDLRDITEEKIAMHMTSVMGQIPGGGDTVGPIPIAEGGIYRLESVLVTYDAGITFTIAEEMESASEIYLYQNSPLARPSMSRPMFTRFLSQSDEGDAVNIRIYPAPTDQLAVMTIHYIVKPRPPRWTYVLIGNDPIYNPAADDARDFHLHPSEEKDLILKILQLSGVSIKDFNLSNAAGNKELNAINQEKA